MKEFDRSVCIGNLVIYFRGAYWERSDEQGSSVSERNQYFASDAYTFSQRERPYMASRPLTDSFVVS